METESGMEVDEEEQQPPPLLVAEVGVAANEKGEEEEGSVLAGDVKGDGEEGGGGLKTSEQLVSSECLDDPNFAIICSFLENFGQHIRLGEFPFDELQVMLENTTEVPERLVKLHIALLRRVFKTITVDKWERSLAKFGHTYCNQDGWEIERFGYKKAKLPTKLRILKNLLESQFDYNVKFKAEVNKLEAGHLRLIPLGRDCEGQVYWYQVDNDANLRVYREDADEETWEIVASNREEFCDLIEKLQKGDVKRPEIDAVVIDEDSNEKEIETKEIILDTGKVDDNNEDGDSFDSDEDLFEKVTPLKTKSIPVDSLLQSSSDTSPPPLTPITEQVESVSAIKTESQEEEPSSIQMEESSDTLVDKPELLINRDIKSLRVENDQLADKIILGNTEEASMDAAKTARSSKEGSTDAQKSEWNTEEAAMRAKETASKVEQKESKLEQKESKVEQKESKVEQKESKLEQKESKVEQKESKVEQKESKVEQKESKVEQKESKVEQKESKVEQKGSKVEQKESKVEQKESKVKASTRKGQESNNKAEETAGKAEETAGKAEETLRKAEKTARKTEETASIAEKAGLRAEETASIAEKAGLRAQKTAGKPEEIAAKTEETADNADGTAQKAQEAARKVEKTTWKAEETLRKAEKTARKAEENAEATVSVVSGMDLKTSIRPSPQAEDFVKKVEVTPVQQTNPKLYQPYQDAVNLVRPENLHHKTSSSDVSLKQGQSIAPDTLLKIEEEVIKVEEEEAHDKNTKVEVRGPKPHASSFPQTDMPVKSSSGTQELVFETFEATKTWTCGERRGTGASKTEIESMQTDVIPPFLEKPFTKDESSSLIMDSEPINLRKLSSEIKTEKNHSKKLDYPNREITLSTNSLLKVEEDIEEGGTVQQGSTGSGKEILKDNCDRATNVIKTQTVVGETSESVQLNLHPLCGLPEATKEEVTSGTTDATSNAIAKEMNSDQGVNVSSPVKVRLTEENRENALEQKETNVGAAAESERTKTENYQETEQDKNSLEYKAVPFSCVKNNNFNKTPLITDSSSRTEVSTVDSSYSGSLEASVEKHQGSSSGVNSSELCSEAPLLVESSVEPSSSIVSSTKDPDMFVNVVQCASIISTKEKCDSSEKISEPEPEKAQVSQFPLVSSATVISTPLPKQPYSISVLLEPKRIPSEKEAQESPQEFKSVSLDSVSERTEVNLEKKNENELQLAPNTNEETICPSPVIEVPPPLANVECTLSTDAEKDLDSQLIMESSEPASNPRTDSVGTEAKLSTEVDQSLTCRNSSLDLERSESKCSEAGMAGPLLPSSQTERSETDVVRSEKQLEEAPTSITPPTRQSPLISNSPIKESKSTTSALLGLASYDSSSDEEEDTSELKKKDITEAVSAPIGALSESVLKRKAEGQGDVPVKVAKLEEHSELAISSPIVGEAVEEEVMHIIGEGSGTMNEGGNDEALTSQRSQTLSSQDEPDSSNDDSQESLEIQKPRKRGRPGKPGKRGRKPGTKMGSLNTTPKERKPRSSTGSRGNREIARLGVPAEALETNGNGEGANDRPVRASRRIAQIRMKEEEERRKLEEERLAQLKADQLRKQEKKTDIEKHVTASGGTLKTKKSKKSSDKTSGTVEGYLPSPSASDSSSGEDDGDEFQVTKLKKGRKKKRRANGKQTLKPGNKPWATSSSDEDSEAVEEEEEYHYEEEEQLVFNESDHEFSPESDLGEDSEAHPSRHARTAKRGEKEEEEETGCRKCSKGDHPEWILLCDKCDQGWHASCLRPQLWVIPEGEWFCPPCQHNMLVTKLSVNLVEFDKLLKKRENDILRKQRLAFVNVSLNNVLPEQTEEEKAVEALEIKTKKDRERTARRRRILSDEELSDAFINDHSDDNGRSDNSEGDSEDGPIYRLRARRAAKTFDYKEYDDMINSALRASDDEAGEEQVDSVAAENGALNGDEDEPKVEGEESQGSNPDEEKHSGKNEAYEKYLQQQEKEFDSDDELMDEKERLRRKAAKSKGSNKKKKRSFRDLEDYTDEDNSDEDFKGSEAEDDEELDEDAVEDDESEWSGDNDESDDSLARKSRVTAKGKKVKYGRREEYLDVGSVRRSTRARRKARVSYDESDQDDDDEPEEKWQSDASEEEETPSESDDETYGKRKKKKAPPPRSAVPRFFLGTIGKETKKAPKKKKRKVDEDDVDRAWSSSQGSKAKKKAAEEQVERRTRGRKINFKDILDSGESDDDGNIRPKRRRISSDEEEDEAESSRRLAEEIKAANQREAAMYAAMQKQNTNSSVSKPTAAPLLASALSGTVEVPVVDKAAADGLFVGQKEKPPALPQESLTSSSSPLELLSNSAKSLCGTLPMSSESAETTVDPTPPLLKPEKSLSSATLEMALSKPVPAPPIPPALAKALGRMKSSSNPPAGPGAAVNPKSHSTLPSESLLPAHPPVVPMTSASLPVISQVQLRATSPPVTVSTSPSKHSRSKKEKASKVPPSASPPGTPSSTPPSTVPSPLRPMTPPMQQALGVMPPQGLPPGLPIDIGRVPNPTLYQGNPAMRPFHPMWVRNPAPPPYGGGGGPPVSIGKPPPLNSGPFMAQHAAQRPGFPSQPPPLRIPNPNPSPLQAFQHFKRDQVPSHGMYRMPPGQQGGLPGILAAGLMGQQGPPDARFFGAPNPFSPYGILPPHTQSQQHPSMFGVPPYEFRPGEPFGKDEPRGTPPPVGTSSPPVSQPLPPSTGTAGPKDDAPTAPTSQTESEFGGLVSYFSSQRSEEDMDS